MREYPLHTIYLSGGSKSNSKTAYAYSIDGALVSRRIHNTASVSTAELMGIFACLFSLTHLSLNNKFLLLTDTLFSLHSLTDLYSTSPLVQRIHLTIHTLNLIGSQITFAWIPSYIGFPEHDAVDYAAKQATLFTQMSNTPEYQLPTIRTIITPFSSKNGTLAGKISP